MKTYIKPLTDIVILNMVSDTMQHQYENNPQGSYTVNQLENVEEEIIGGDDANSFNKSLWDEE